jgi:DNA-binding NarL/FixJ family response regulator
VGNKEISVLIIDDHPMMRGGLRAVIEGEDDMVVVGEAADGAEGVDLFTRLQPAVTLLDLQMPKFDGLQALTAIRRQAPTAAIVVFTVYPGDAKVTQALNLGATSYLVKSANRLDIVTAVRDAASGLQTIAPELEDAIAAHRGKAGLTVREIGVLRLVKSGLSNQQIGKTLSISEDTVKTHIKNILMKLGATDRTQAVYIAVHRGFIDP